MDIKIFKLITGETIISKFFNNEEIFSDEEVKFVEWETPFEIKILGFDEDSGGMVSTLIPYLYCAEDDSVIINEKNIICSYVPDSKTLNDYRTFIGDKKIEEVSKKIIY